MIARRIADPATGGGAPDRLSAVHEQLVAAVGALVVGDAWQRMLGVAARFHRYSPNNVLLITVQRPDATRVAGYQTWRELGRQVRRGENGITILAPVTRRRDPAVPTEGPAPAPALSGVEPDGDAGRSRVLRGFRIAHVYDISQTDGPPLPEVRPDLLNGAAPLGVWADLLDQIEASGFTFNYTDAVTLTPANGLTDYTARTVVVREDLSGAQRVKTLAHELAHVRLHDPTDPSRPPELTRAQAEVEAESVAHIVCAAHGLATDAYTVPYVAGWAGGDSHTTHELLQQTALRVLATSRTILSIAAPPADGVTDPRTLAAARATDRATTRAADRTVASAADRGLAAQAAQPQERSHGLTATPAVADAGLTASTHVRGIR